MLSKRNLQYKPSSMGSKSMSGSVWDTDSSRTDPDETGVLLTKVKHILASAVPATIT